MLKSATIAMTILGCNCEQNTCEYIRTADLAVASLADCQARMKSEIERTRAEYPLVVAVCENLPQATATVVATAESDAPVFDVRPVAQPAQRSILVKVRERYSSVMNTAGDGLGTAAKFVSVPASWFERQIVAVQELQW